MKKQTIRMEVESPEHFTVFFNAPGRIEVTLRRNHLVAFVYRGAKVKPGQTPLFHHDSHDGGALTMEHP